MLSVNVQFWSFWFWWNAINCANLVGLRSTQRVIAGYLVHSRQHVGDPASVYCLYLSVLIQGRNCTACLCLFYLFHWVCFFVQVIIEMCWLIFKICLCWDNTTTQKTFLSSLIPLQNTFHCALIKNPLFEKESNLITIQKYIMILNSAVSCQNSMHLSSVSHSPPRPLHNKHSVTRWH